MVDINEEAVRLCLAMKDKIDDLPNITIKESDLFNQTDEIFDVVIFNPVVF